MPRAVRFLAPLTLSIPLTLGALTVAPAHAYEGQWKPAQITEVHDRARQAGLELSPTELWTGADPNNPTAAGGLLRAAVNIGGCTAAFISAEGLMSTNHHCAYGALQANSTVEHDYLANGFMAPTRADELGAPGKTVRILDRVTDVTAQIEAKLAGIKDDRARAQAFDAAKVALVDACEAEQAHRSCQFASFFGNSRFELHAYLELLDVRLVYAPPSAIGEYGGETDNWMWPRHTGDFSLLRAYVGPDGQPAAYSPDNIPYKPAEFLVPSPEGVDEGDFVAILGYPGNTDRYMAAVELERHLAQWLPMRVALFGEWIAILERNGARDPAVKIKVAAIQKTLANRYKNAAGKIAGLERIGFIETRKAEDQKLASQSPAAQATLDELTTISTARAERAAWAFLLENLGSGPRGLAIARELNMWSEQQAKPDAQRKPGYRERDRDKVWTRLEQHVKDHDAAVDAELLASFLTHADALEGRRIAGFDKLLGKAKGAGLDDRAAYLDAARAKLTGSALADATALRKLFDDPKAVAKSKDPMLALARSLAKDLEQLAALDEADRGRMLFVEPRYFALISELRGQPLYPDANSTLRFSYAKVQGYTKWDGAVQTPQTTLAEAVAKHTDSGEFDLPDGVLAKASAGPESRWADAELDDVPIAFLADGDTTGGNSGSPVIDSKGRLIGFNFDRVWETVSGDYAWRTEQSRNVISDARYLYWMLEEVEGGAHLLAELGVADYQPPAPPAVIPEPVAPEPIPPKSGGCEVTDPEEASPLGLIGFLVFLVAIVLFARWRARQP